MRYVAAALLAALGGNTINAENIKKILDSVGIECEKDKVKLVVAELAGKNIAEVMELGQSKLSSVPAGGAAVAAGGPAGDAAPQQEEKKEEKKEEPEEESDDDMGFGLFD